MKTKRISPNSRKKLQCVVFQVKAEVTKDQSRKQDTGHAESDSANLDARETQPNDGNQRNKKYRIGNRISARVILKPCHHGMSLYQTEAERPEHFPCEWNKGRPALGP